MAEHKFFDPSGLHSSDAVQVGEGMGDEYEEGKGKASASASDEREKVADIKARIEDMDDDELNALDEDDRKGVQDALAAERARRAEAASDDS